MSENNQVTSLPTPQIGDFVEKATCEEDHNDVVQRMVEGGFVDDDYAEWHDKSSWDGFYLDGDRTIVWCKASQSTITRRYTVDQYLGREPKHWLPEVGVVCECILHGEWDTVEVVAHHGDNVIFTAESLSPEYNGRTANCFRPLKTERELVIEEAVKYLDDINTMSVDSMRMAYVASLYDAGYLKKPNSNG